MRPSAISSFIFTFFTSNYLSLKIFFLFLLVRQPCFCFCFLKLHQHSDDFLFHLLLCFFCIIMQFQYTLKCEICTIHGFPFSWLIVPVFQGILTNETKCLRCETVTARDETFLDLSLDIEQNSSITSCLKNFSSTETLNAEDKFFCDKCCRSVTFLIHWQDFDLLCWVLIFHWSDGFISCYSVLEQASILLDLCFPARTTALLDKVSDCLTI